MNSAIETVSTPEAVSASAGSAIASATVENEINVTGRKPYIRRDGHVGPISQLKLRPLEEKDWAVVVAARLPKKPTMTADEKQARIRKILGVD
jgi:hypothetical protein